LNRHLQRVDLTNKYTMARKKGKHRKRPRPSSSPTTLSTTKKIPRADPLPSCQDLSTQARKIWLSATTGKELRNAEQLYRQAVDIARENLLDTEDEVDEDAEAQFRSIVEKLSLLWIQSERANLAINDLSELGYICRLSSTCLDYPEQQSEVPNLSPKIIQKSLKAAPCLIFDEFLTKSQEAHLKSCLGDPKSSYWADHDYCIEPPSSYFSYVLPLNQAKEYGFLGDLIDSISHSSAIRHKFPKVNQAKFVELWIHNRPHASGHQLHFDSDNEGIGGVRNPIISTIVYVNASSGGPSLVTNQTLKDTKLATRGYLVHPKARRVVAFDGTVLHGVIPGKDFVPGGGRRVTLMLAFWNSIRIRPSDTPGAARPFPKNDQNAPEWLKGLTSYPKKYEGNPPPDTTTTKSPKKSAKLAKPIVVDRVYESLNGDAWSEEKGMPEYDELFQGF
jgi:hypothetical protein